MNISSRSWNHATSLHFCSQLGKMENLNLLLKYGANVFIKDKCGHTARDRAQKHPECESILQEQEGKIFIIYLKYMNFWRVVLWLVCLSLDRAVRVRAVLCSWARHLTLTVPLSTQVHKWVPANLIWGGNPVMD